MLTKTGELLMRKKNQLSQNRSGNIRVESASQKKVELEIKPQRMNNQISHVTHVNEYNFISVSNKSPHQLQVSKDLLKQFQVQNFRLIEQNMKLVEWSRNFLLKTRQNLMKIIQGIEEFKYLESVNKLYETIGELSEYEESGFRLPKANTKEHYLHLTKMNNPQSKKLISPELEMRRMVSFTYLPEESKEKGSTFKDKRESKEEIQVITPKFLHLNMKADYSDFEPTEGEAHLFNMLLLQSMCIQSLIDAHIR